ncbi:hypothetical protein AWV72_00217 [Lactiplantibacillus plantarum]|uniref:hypothetical protein n=1 Tax=Lactiplantibacillus plantarum TaxID=1590 RepID=UPI00083FA390|nr:hypothetical protein [Lactiplantibacillus plantarum]AOG31035.1 hypothetical protein AWV72_00217 [Lactiplantibacillus plantarum]MDR7676906.1 hypothetical protein [Lactiplantibacillus plantarum]
MKIETLQEELEKNEAELKTKTVASRSLLDKEDSDIAEIKRSVDEVKELRSKSDGLREKIEALKSLNDEENRASKTDSKGDSAKEDGDKPKKTARTRLILLKSRLKVTHGMMILMIVTMVDQMMTVLMIQSLRKTQKLRLKIKEGQEK